MNGDFSLLSVVSKEMIANLNVFGFGMLNRVLGDGNSTSVVAEDWSVGEFVAIIQQLILDP